MTWTPELDALLSRTVAANPEASNREIADLLSATGFPVRKDQVQKRRKRITTFETSPPVIEDEAGFVLPEPADGFVGLRVVYWDLETTDLKAFMGRLLCCSIADSWGNVTTRRATDFPQQSALDDSGLAEWVRDTLETYDVLVSWNGFMFDHGFLAARLLRWGKRPMGRKMAVDPMWKARQGRYSARIGGSSLATVSKFFRTNDTKSEISWEQWSLAGLGDPDAMAEVVDHCERDVLVLRSVFGHLKPLIQTIHQ